MYFSSGESTRFIARDVSFLPTYKMKRAFKDRLRVSSQKLYGVSKSFLREGHEKIGVVPSCLFAMKTSVVKHLDSFMMCWEK